MGGKLLQRIILKAFVFRAQFAKAGTALLPFCLNPANLTFPRHTDYFLTSSMVGSDSRLGLKFVRGICA